MSLAAALSEPLRSARPVAVLDRALAKGRLGHALLFHGPDLALLEELGLTLAARLLGTSAERAIRHPDCFTVRPAKKSRTITADPMREVVRNVNLAPHAGERKVALVFEADRLRREAENIFLKTLEEPPGDATLILLTTRPYELLPTIRSRCLLFRLPGGAPTLSEDWQAWRGDFSRWVVAIRDGTDAATGTLGGYALQQRLEALIKADAEARIEALPQEETELLEDEERLALESGQNRAARQKAYQVLAETAPAALVGIDDEAEVDEGTVAARIAQAWRLHTAINDARFLSETLNVQITPALESVFLQIGEIA